jgi:endonuclease/exonuclease/phosphatase family metal-dependent hydrolase
VAATAWQIGGLPGTKFLFWNIGRRPLAPLIAELAEEHGVDIIVLAECDVDIAAMLATLNRRTAAFHFPLSFTKRIAIYTRFSGEFLKPSFESERISIRTLTLPARLSVLLAAVHLPSKLRWSEESQRDECVELARAIAEVEVLAGHRRTILVGDFNMNPFEKGFASSVGLNSVMSRRIASRISRTVQSRKYHFFYNPMWNHFGDARGDTAGSYYYNSAEHVNYYWNVFDQVLLRPELAERFDPGRLRILTSIGPLSLVRADGRPNETVGSDHLPLLFEVEF